MVEGSSMALFEEVPVPSGKVRAQPVIVPQGETSNANLKEAFGRLVVFGIYVNDPMAILSPMIWLAIPLLRAAGKGEEYKDRIDGWKRSRDTAIRIWNTKNGQWKVAKIEAENTIADVMEVAIREKIVVITRSMWDIGDLVAHGGGVGPDEPGAGAEPRSM
jgi:hypothetical protein